MVGLVMATPLRDALWLINLATLLGLWLPALAAWRADEPNPKD